MTLRRRLAAAALAAVVSVPMLGGLGLPVQPTLALLKATETVASTFSTETLDPPTSLTGTAQILLRVNLSWTATVDTRATGYQVLRGTASGGPYTQIATVTPRTTTTYQDIPIVPGTYYYVLRTYFASWTSGNSNQVSVTAI